MTRDESGQSAGFGVGQLRAERPLDANRFIYTGLVVGGPMDGQQLACRSQVYTLALESTESLFYNTAGNRIEDRTLEISKFEYEWKPLHISAQGEQLTVWAPRGASKVETLRLLLAGYKP